MSYYFCVDIPLENTCITGYDTLKELYEEEKETMKRNKDWYIIKGEELKDGEFSFWCFSHFSYTAYTISIFKICARLYKAIFL